MNPEAENSEIKKKKILLIDDEVFFLQMAKSILEKAGRYEVLTLISARELERWVSEFSPDVILLDIAMPDAEGIDACSSLKNNPLLKHIPVVMLSAMSRDKDKAKAFCAGADDFIAKPVKREDLIAKIEEVLGRRKSTEK